MWLPTREAAAPGSSPSTGDATAIDAAIVEGYARPGTRAGPLGVRGSARRDQGRALVARGEVWWVEHPEAGRRPFLVLTRQAAIPVLNALLAVPATRTVRRIPTEVVLDTDDGMPEECALSLDNLTLVPKELFRTRITRLSLERMTEVWRALGLASGCS